MPGNRFRPNRALKLGRSNLREVSQMQPSAPVTFILDSTYGLKAVAHAKSGPVWLVNSPYNAQAAGGGRAEGLNCTLLTPNGQSPEEWFLSGLDTVDQHHNEYSEVVGYSELQVIGVELTPSIEQYLPEFGFVYWEPTAEGFVANKIPSPSRASDA